MLRCDEWDPPHTQKGGGKKFMLLWKALITCHYVPSFTVFFFFFFSFSLLL